MTRDLREVHFLRDGVGWGWGFKSYLTQLKALSLSFVFFFSFSKVFWRAKHVGPIIEKSLRGWRTPTRGLAFRDK